jgi:hypothetical protein
MSHEQSEMEELRNYSTLAILRRLLVDYVRTMQMEPNASSVMVMGSLPALWVPSTLASCHASRTCLLSSSNVPATLYR